MIAKFRRSGQGSDRQSLNAKYLSFQRRLKNTDGLNRIYLPFFGDALLQGRPYGEVKKA